ncbi:MAG: hypothetical protein JHC40_10665 [Burkholderiales bacterium]|jgi:hypothetical protein|nr:hypothetical protein [Burkholderiales bacterium]
MHELAAMLLVIVGQTPFPTGLCVGAVSAQGVVSLHADATHAPAAASGDSQLLSEGARLMHEIARVPVC